MTAPPSGRRVFYLVSAEGWEFCKLGFKWEFGSLAFYTRVSVERLPTGTFLFALQIWVLQVCHRTLFFETAHHLTSVQR